MGQGPETLSPGCYGKLPFWPEFLDAEGGNASARFLREWIHRGRDHNGYGRIHEGTEITETRRRRFLFALPGLKELLAGTIGPSADLERRRGFPFAVFVALPRAVFGKHLYLAPLALAGAFEDLEDLWAALAAASNRPAFDQAMAGFRIRGPLPGEEVRLHYRAGLQHEIESLLDGQDGIDLSTLAGRLQHFLEEIRAGGGPSAVFELPVGRELGQACFDLSFWIDLINRPLFWSAVEPSVFLDPRPGVGSRTALLVPRAPSAADYPVVMGGAPGPGTPVRIGHPGSGGGPPSRTGGWGRLPSYGALLGE